MPALEVRFIVASKEARLMLVRDADVLEDELWKFERPMGRSEQQQMVRAVFDSTYDFLNYTVNGGDE